MALLRSRLPKKSESRVRVIGAHADRARTWMSARRAMWTLAWWYLQGYRRFSSLNLSTGQVSAYMTDQNGNLEFRGAELARTMDRVKAQLSAMDVRPVAECLERTLEMRRQRGVAQVVADAVLRPHAMDQAKAQAAQYLTALGCCGYQEHVVKLPSGEVVAEPEVIHPRELYPWPLPDEDYTRTSGLMRDRVVPLDFLKERFGRRIADNLEDLEYWTVQPGEAIGSADLAGSVAPLAGGAGYRTNYGVTSMKAGGSAEDDSMIVVRVVELWTDGQGGTVGEYCAISGDYELAYKDLTGTESYRPISFSRFMDNGTWFGIGMFDLAYSYSRELERMAKMLFENIRTADRYPVLVVPGGTISERAITRETGEKLRYAVWNPENPSENLKMEQLAPVDMRDMPGKVAEFALNLLDRISPVQDILQEKGRVDSAQALMFLENQSREAMTSPTQGMASLFSEAHRAAVSRAVQEYVVGQDPIPAVSLTLELAGVVLDPEGGSIRFPKNPVPNLSKIRFGIREISPRNPLVRRVEAIQNFAQGLMDPTELRILAVKEGLDIAVDLGPDEAAYDAVVRNILMVVGDGETPGEEPVVIYPATTRPDIQLRVLDEFLSGPTAASLSTDVLAELFKYREAMLQHMGMTLPNMVPLPEEAALFGPAPMGPGGPGGPGGGGGSGGEGPPGGKTPRKDK